jgi:hypothetical protein
LVSRRPNAVGGDVASGKPTRWARRAAALDLWPKCLAIERVFAIVSSQEAALLRKDYWWKRVPYTTS